MPKGEGLLRLVEAAAAAGVLTGLAAGWVLVRGSGLARRPALAPAIAAGFVVAAMVFARGVRRGSRDRQGR